MTRYAVGDIQGCLQALQCLLEQVNFNPAGDQLWLVGDLINRGPDSLGTLRYIKSLGDCTRIVLGNHDLHFLAVAAGSMKPGRSDTFKEILAAKDLPELVHWLQQQPLMYSDPSGDYHMSHAGIPPQWTITEAQSYAREVEAILRGDKKKKRKKYYTAMYGNEPNIWHNKLNGLARLRVITNYFTRMRFCTAEGALDFKYKLTRIDLPGYRPWFSHPQRKTAGENILFGHWAALEGKVDTDKVFALDTGCVWGRQMTLMNLENQQLLHCECTKH